MKIPGSSGNDRSFAWSVLAACLVFGFVCAAPLAADRLELRNGDVITGTVVRLDEETVLIRTEYGTLEVARDAVLRGSFGMPEGLVTDDLVLYLPLDGSVDDQAGLNLITNNGMRLVADRLGSPASALRSDGTGTYLSIAPTGELNGLAQFTLTMWVNLEDLGSVQYLFSKWIRADGETADGKFTLQTSGGSLTAYFVDPGGTYHWLTARDVLQENTWQAVAVSFAGGRASLYVDGELAASDRFGFTGLYADSAPILIMTAQAQTEDPFNYYNAVGSVDEVRLYSRPLSPDEVLSLAAESATE